MSRLMPCFALLLLTACNVDTKLPQEGDDNVMINASESGKVAFDLPFAKGEINLPSGFMNDGNVDIDGVKLMPGSKVTGFSVLGENQESTVNIAFSAPKSADEVRTYFVDQFAKQGGKASLSGNAVNATTKDGDPVTVSVDPAGTGSNGMIVIHSTDKVS